MVTDSMNAPYITEYFDLHSRRFWCVLTWPRVASLHKARRRFLLSDVTYTMSLVCNGMSTCGMCVSTLFTVDSFFSCIFFFFSALLTLLRKHTFTLFTIHIFSHAFLLRYLYLSMDLNFLQYTYFSSYNSKNTMTH